MLPLVKDPHLIVGYETGEDAGLYKLSEDIALIQTLDFFTPKANDPYIFGQIAAMGTEIYSCGVCLKYYNLEPELKVGHRGTAHHIVEGFKDFIKVLWIS